MHAPQRARVLLRARTGEARAPAVTRRGAAAPGGGPAATTTPAQSTNGATTSRREGSWPSLYVSTS